MRTPKILTLTLAAVAVLGAALLPQNAHARSPLTQEGKTSVYQRIVTHPGAKLYAGPDAGAQVLRDPLKTFTVMYIYGRQGSRLEVGASSSQADGWVDAAEVTEWPQAITMVFTDRTGRAPVLFFRDRKGLEEACQAASVADKVRGYAAELKATGGKVAPDFPVLATEPAETAVSEKNFYLLPVLGMNDRYRGLKMVEVASIDPGISAARPVATAQQGGGGGAALAADAPDYRTGFAFVIDTTISMKPYIDQTLSLVRKLYDELEKNPHGDKMAFAVVAFRSNIEKAPGVEYTAKPICDFTTVKDRKRLEDALAEVERIQTLIQELEARRAEIAGEVALAVQAQGILDNLDVLRRDFYFSCIITVMILIKRLQVPLKVVKISFVICESVKVYPAIIKFSVKAHEFIIINRISHVLLD